MTANQVPAQQASQREFKGTIARMTQTDWWKFASVWILQPAFWMLFLFALQSGWSWWSNRSFRQLWGGIINGRQRVPVIIGDVEFKDFVSQDSQASTVHLPPNVPLFGVGDAVAMSLIHETLLRCLHGGNAPVLFASQSDAEIATDTFVSVGGPSVNKVTGRVLVDMKLDGKLRMVYHPDNSYAVDEFSKREFRPERNKDGTLKKDYGFIVIGPSPFDKRQTACLVFGVWPQGTQAAARELLQPEDSEPGPRLVNRVREHLGAVAVVQTVITNFSQGTPLLIEVRSLQD
jgi:hypothetical protein